MDEKIEEGSKSSRTVSSSEGDSSETVQERQLQLLKSRLLPLTRHPVYGRKLDMSDSALYKWLAHCDNSAFLADAKIRTYLQYRTNYGIDRLLRDYTPPHFANYYPGGICGVDKEGSPVYYELFGTLNMKDIMSSATKQQLIAFKIYQHEKIVKHLQVISKTSRKKVDTILVIVDMQRCSIDTLWNPALRAWAEIIEVLQGLYPGLVKEVLVINVHLIFPELYITLRPYLSRSTLKLIKVMGQGYLKHLLQRIEKHEIPAFLGGYKCDYNNNPYCLTNLNWNNTIPQFLHFTNMRIVAHVTNRTILGGEKCLEEYHVPTPKSDLIWEFYEISHPVMFSIYLNMVDDKNVVLGKTLISNKKSPKGSLTCLTPGRYFLLFDNCKDFARSASVIFKVEVQLPHDIMSRFVPKISLGDTINFRHPVGEKEKRTRQELFFKYPHARKDIDSTCL